MSNYYPSEDLNLNISRGLVKGTSFIHKFGSVPSMSISTTGTIWDVDDTLYPWSAWANTGTLSVQTTLVNGTPDTADSGLDIVLVGLDDDFNVIEETVTISGSTGTTTSIFSRIYRAYTSENNTTQFRVSRDATEVARINIGKAQTLMSLYTVPLGYTGHMCKQIASLEYGADATINTFVRYGGTGAFRISHTGEVSGSGMPYSYKFTVPLPFPEKTDIDIRAVVRTNNARVTSAFDIILIKNGLV